MRAIIKSWNHLEGTKQVESPEMPENKRKLLDTVMKYKRMMVLVKWAIHEELKAVPSTKSEALRKAQNKSLKLDMTENGDSSIRDGSQTPKSEGGGDED